jgi:hypothetical protein
LYWSYHPETKKRFDYLVEWDPECLMTGTNRGLPLVHAIVKYKIGAEKFNMFLKAALK